MSLKENQLGDHNAVFKEWIGKYSILKPYTQDGVPRQLTANSLSGFNPPPGNQQVQKWIDDIKKQRGRSGGTTDPNSTPGTPAPPPTFTIQFDEKNAEADKTQLQKALQNIKNSCAVVLYIAREKQDKTTEQAPWSIACVKFTAGQ
jgi:hypothetical protein